MNTPIQPIARLRLPDREYLLYPGQQVRIGRSDDNEIVLDDPKISRCHVQIAWNGGGFFVQDLGSRNGTYVNVSRLDGTPRALQHGDQISLSRSALVFELLDPALLLAGLPEGTAAASGSRGPCLVVADGLDLGREYPLWGEAVVIGRESREATWEIRLTDRSVSRPHARLDLSEAGYVLVDLDSANGTRLNDQPVTGPVLIQDGDVIGVGGTLMAYRAAR